MRTITRTAVAGLLAASLLLVGCGSDSGSDAAGDNDATTTAPKADIEITDVWARQSPSGATMGAAYMTITSAEDDMLISASVSSDVAAEAQIHETVMSDESSMGSDTTMGEDMASTTMAEDMTSTTMAEDMTSTTMGEDMGTMTMKEIDSLELPAGKAVALEPGGYHIMLIDLVKPLEVGDSIEITLTFENAGEKTITAEVKEG